ncbi:MAG: prepilin-type N-terminal cleavage/methylation domain-containing protein [Desulfovibrio sp.]|nr:prepilin-type N-terminal cleavage/methylation domain-containing protein [Desulfovibrio sp.]
MSTRRIAANGFTLIELLFCLAIIGAALGLGVAFFVPKTPEMKETASRIVSALSRARVDAMLSRQKTVVQLDGDGFYQLNADGSRREMVALPPDVRARVNGKTLTTAGSARFVFGPLGYSSEQLIHLESPERVFSIYIPSLASPLAIEGAYSLEQLRKERQ